MPRRARLFLEGAVYHVYNRFARGADLFQIGDEGERFIDLTRAAIERDGQTVLAWCVMSNHYHLAMRTGPVPLARTMGYVQSRFGQVYNRRWRSSGPLWQSRYKARRLEDERQVLQLIAYVHLNPVAAAIVDDPAGYARCGHEELVGAAPRRLVDVDSTLALYGPTVARGRRSYLATLKRARGAEWLGARPGALPWWGEEVDRTLEPAMPMLDPLGRSPGVSRPRLSAEEFITRACAAAPWDLERLVGSGQDREVSRVRYLLAALAIERWRIRSKELADYLGRCPEVVTRWARVGAERRQADESFRRDYETLDATLASPVGAGRSR